MHFKNLCVMKLDTASFSLVMTTFTQRISFNFKCNDLTKACYHTFVRVSRDVTREWSNNAGRKNDVHGAMPKPTSSLIQ